MSAARYGCKRGRPAACRGLVQSIKPFHLVHQETHWKGRSSEVRDPPEVEHRRGAGRFSGEVIVRALKGAGKSIERLEELEMFRHGRVPGPRPARGRNARVKALSAVSRNLCCQCAESLRVKHEFRHARGLWTRRRRSIRRVRVKSRPYATV